MTLALAALASLCLILLLGPPPTRLPRPSRPRVPDPDGSILRRLRLPLATLAGAAAWAFVGGLSGLIAAGVVAPMAWRTLARARGPGAIRRQERLRADYPLVVELLSSTLRAGADVETALTLVMTAVGEPWESYLGPSLKALEVGQSPAAVWADLERDPGASELGRALSRSQATGVPVSEAMRRLAEDLREDADLTAHAYARTIEVRAAVPLGICFLPAFVLLGVIPLVAGVLGDLAWIGQG